jgi:hypothetical protein
MNQTPHFTSIHDYHSYPGAMLFVDFLASGVQEKGFWMHWQFL